MYVDALKLYDAKLIQVSMIVTWNTVLLVRDYFSFSTLTLHFLQLASRHGQLMSIEFPNLHQVT